MMQQQLYQQEQPGTQDTAGHQMVLCPVRVVYETPMLVQQGDQMQSNQTIFINPQNPPPWIQNRAVQNQVIYVQHMPTNYVLPTQQHIDPNQLYIQNYSYQNMPQMLVQNPQEQIRPMQMTPPHHGQGQQPGIGQNVQTQRLVSNISAISNSLNLVNTAQNQNNVINRQFVNNQMTNINEIVNNVKQENLGQNMYRQVSQTLPQDPRNQMQQTVTIVPNNIQRPTNTYEQNISQMQQIPQQNVANIQNYQNSIMHVQEARKQAPINKNINYNVVHPNISVKGPQSFRPIQPRTNQIRNNGPQFLTAQPTTGLIQSAMPNMLNKNVPRKITSNSTNQMTNTIAISNNGKIEGNSLVFNRKRKSESPDELHKKISISNNTENPIIIKKIENVTNPVICSDIGVNTSPVHKTDGRININNLQITPLNPINTQNAKIKEELAKKPISYPKEPQNVIRNNIIPSSVPGSVPTEKDKLIRNTVYTQARGRVLNDKQTVVESSKPEIPTTTIISNSPVATIRTEVSQKQPTDSNDNSKEKIKHEEPDKTNNATVTPIVAEKKSENTEDNKTLSSNEKVADNIKLKEDRDFVLTHVLDGYVIQESNIAFPIRKPLKEKPLPNNSDETESKDLKEAKADGGVKNNSKILNISHLQIKDIEPFQKDNGDDKENPFHTLKPSVVKSWTAEQLETHLRKFGWNETVSVLQEHEIDGESLLLVSKGQLLTIGVKDEHAEIISHFVKS
ncbi:probable basic-leucine zipper transcription factor S isoform X1 [Nymphalis io]|uniref:probable basic-leucine zipper transcription factor S isoform X1 n=2 Tax=Inachis io TaxID=171585 RepID=UPI002167D77C|nr:probable basic-leucine zipper transcription factor S isoform X1 [Nymphalis io]